MFERGRRYRLLFFEIADGDGVDLHGIILRQPGNAQDRTGRRIHWKIVDEGFVQFAVLIYVSKINLNVNNVSHSETRCIDHIFYIIE